MVYTEKYPSLRPLVEPIPAAPEVVAEARARGWLVVVATQPLFPLTAIVQRMEWGGLDPEAFDYITHMEAFHACKPSSHFFEELCQTIDVPPSRCVMVGNDVHDDMPAANVGIATFLAKDFLLRADHPAPPPRAEGAWQTCSGSSRRASWSGGSPDTRPPFQHLAKGWAVWRLWWEGD